MQPCISVRQPSDIPFEVRANILRFNRAIRHAIDNGWADTAYTYARLLTRYYQRELLSQAVETVYRRIHAPNRASHIESAQRENWKGAHYERLAGSRTMIRESSYEGRIMQREYRAIMRQTGRMV